VDLSSCRGNLAERRWAEGGGRCRLGDMSASRLKVTDESLSV